MKESTFSLNTVQNRVLEKSFVNLNQLVSSIVKIMGIVSFRVTLEKLKKIKVPIHQKNFNLKNFHIAL